MFCYQCHKEPIHVLGQKSSERKNVSMALPDIIDDIQTNKSLAKTKDGNEVKVENKSTLSIHK